MDIKQLNLFISLANTLNFTKTASEFFITQPTLSHQISLLEDELGSRLFVRAPHKVYLTESGKVFLEHANNIVNESRTAVSRVYEVAHGHTGYLRIMTILPCVDIAIKTVSKFKKLYPDVHIDMEVSTGSEQSEAISNSSVDVIISFSSLVESHSQLEHRKISSENWTLIYNEELFTIDDPSDLSSLNNIPMVCEYRETAPFLTDSALSVAKEVNLEPEHILWCNGPTSMVMSVKSNLGYAIIPAPEEGGFGLEGLKHCTLSATVDCSAGWSNIKTNPAVDNYLSILNELYPEVH